MPFKKGHSGNPEGYSALRRCHAEAKAEDSSDPNSLASLDNGEFELPDDFAATMGVYSSTSLTDFTIPVWQGTKDSGKQ